MPDRCKDVGEILRPFLIRINNIDDIIDVIIKKDWRINYADHTIGRYRNIHR